MDFSIDRLEPGEAKKIPITPQHIKKNMNKVSGKIFKKRINKLRYRRCIPKNLAFLGDKCIPLSYEDDRGKQYHQLIFWLDVDGMFHQVTLILGAFNLITHVHVNKTEGMMEIINNHEDVIINE